MSSESANWNALTRAAKAAGPRLVLLYGSGANAHILEAAGTPISVGWSELLRRAAARALGSPEKAQRVERWLSVDGVNTLLWDRLAADAAESLGGAHRAERVLQKAVAQELDEIYTPELRRRARAGWVELLGRYEDVGTFNFDGLVTRPVRGNEAFSKPRTWRSPIALHGALEGTRVWFPHGHISKPSTIVLGAHLYGNYLPDLRGAFDRHMKRERTGTAAGVPPTWLDLLLEDRPVVFVGLSLSREEWTVWWSLVRRARRWARHTTRPPTFIVQAAPPAGDPVRVEAFRRLRAGAELVDGVVATAENYRLCWERLQNALRA